MLVLFRLTQLHTSLAAEFWTGWSGWMTVWGEPIKTLFMTWGCGGSIGRASASRPNGFDDQRFESLPEHKKNL